MKSKKKYEHAVWPNGNNKYQREENIKHVFKTDFFLKCFQWKTQQFSFYSILTFSLSWFSICKNKINSKPKCFIKTKSNNFMLKKLFRAPKLECELSSCWMNKEVRFTTSYRVLYIRTFTNLSENKKKNENNTYTLQQKQMVLT